MDDNDLLKLIEQLRQRVREFKHSLDGINGGSLSVFSANVIEISAALTEMGVVRNRRILKEERYWFEAAYHFNFEFVGGAWQDIYDMYIQLVKEVELRRYSNSEPHETSEIYNE